MEQKNKLKQTPFTVPENYFASLEDEVMQKVHSRKEFRINRILWVSSSAAAAVILALFIWFKPAMQEQPLLSALEIENYFELNGESYDEVLIYENLDKTEAIDLTLEEQEEIIDYLLRDEFENELFLAN